MVDNIPHILAGRYEVGELIGRGGMAEVHIGYDARLSRTVAIKLLRSDLSEDSTFHARFRREAQSAAALNHPAIVAVYDTGEEMVKDARGQDTTLPYIVMEYVEGHTVRELLRDGAAVPIDEAAEIMAGVLGALEYAHNEGIVHRDIKPGNIMLTPTGQVKVMDFGIARALGDTSATMTQANSVVGTAQYLSPEQARGEQVDGRSDLYSAGCVLYELLAGRPPFQGESPVSVAYQHVREVPPVPSSVAGDIPDSLDRVVMKSLAKDRNERYQDAAQFRSDLLAAARGQAVSAPLATQWLPVGGGAATPSPATSVMPSSSTPAAAATPAAAGINPTATGTLPATRPLQDDDAKKSNWWIWLLALLGVSLLAFGIWKLFLEGEPDPTTTQVPALTGLNQVDAAAALEAAELVMNNMGEEASDTVPVGEFVRSEPGEGTEVEIGSSVDVWFSSGVAETTVPDVEGMSQPQARTAIENANLEVGPVETKDEPGRPAGEVYATDPPIGTAVDEGTEITLFIASGNVELPDLRGMTEADAEAALEALKLESTVEYAPSNDYPSGQVVSQSDTGIVATDATIALVVSEGTKTAPVISGVDAVTIQQGDSFDPRAGVTASDEEDGDITGSITVDGTVDTNTPGTYTLVYSVQDTDGMTDAKNRTVTVQAAPEPEPEPEPTQDEGDGPPTGPGNNNGNP